VLELSDGQTSSTKVIADRLRGLILEGELKPHARLTQRDLADQFGVSAMPVRDAIKQLISEGLVIAEGQKTIVVAPVSSDDFLDVMEMRLALEPRALELAIPFVSPSDLDGLDAILENSTESDPPRVAVEQHWHFHQSLYKPCRRSRMLAAIEAQHLHLNRYLLPNWARVGVGAHWAEVEREIVVLLRALKAKKAIEFLRQDIEKTIVRVVRVLRE
jgi:DNA-binding GntR family transcriptional regulator